MKENFTSDSVKREKIKKRFTAVICIAVFVGCVLLMSGITVIHAGITTLGDSGTRAFNLSMDNFNMTKPVPSTDMSCELMARCIRAGGDSTYTGVWQKDVIFAEWGDMLEVRLKASSDRSEDISREAIYRDGISIAPFNGLKWVEPDTWKPTILSDGTTADYVDGSFDANTQYYYIGTFQLGWGDWLYDDESTPMVKTWKDGEFEATLYVVPPYNLSALRSGIALSAAAAGVFIIISILGIIEAIVTKRLPDTD